ncbi:hypothetical protein ACTFIY_000141 [Dictyostelium cf. discoideum]
MDSRYSDLIRKTISKISQCILLSRVETSPVSRRVNKTFHLETEESDMHRQEIDRIVLRNDMRILFVIEIHFDENIGLGLNTIIESWRIIFDPREIDNSVELPKFYKNVIILIRTIYAMLRNIPCYSLFKNFSKNRSATCSVNYQLRVCDSQSITTPSFPLSTSIKTVSFTAIPTPMGILKIDLSYKENLTREISASSHIGLESQFIIKDYNNYPSENKYENNNNNNNSNNSNSNNDNTNIINNTNNININNNNNDNNNNNTNDNNLSTSYNRDYPSSYPQLTRMGTLQDLLNNKNNNDNNNNPNPKPTSSSPYDSNPMPFETNNNFNNYNNSNANYNFSNINNNNNNFNNFNTNNNSYNNNNNITNNNNNNNYNFNESNNNNNNNNNNNSNTNNNNNSQSNPIFIPGMQNNRQYQQQHQQQYSSSFNKPPSLSSSPPFSSNSIKIGSGNANYNNQYGSSPPFGSTTTSGGININNHPSSNPLPIRQVSFTIPNQTAGISPTSYSNQQSKTRATSAPIAIHQQAPPFQNFPKSSSSGTKSPPFHVSISPFKEPSTLDYYSGGSTGTSGGLIGSNSTGASGGLIGNNSNNNLTLLNNSNGIGGSGGLVGNNSSGNLTLLNSNNNSNNNLIGTSGNNALFNNPLYHSSSPGSTNSFGASGIDRLNNSSMKNSKISQIHGPLLLSEHHINQFTKDGSRISSPPINTLDDNDDAVFVSTLRNSKQTTHESEIADFLKLCKIAPPLKLFNNDNLSLNTTNSQHSLQIGNEIMLLSNINFNKPTSQQYQQPQQQQQYYQNF